MHWYEVDKEVSLHHEHKMLQKRENKNQVR